MIARFQIEKFFKVAGLAMALLGPSILPAATLTVGTTGTYATLALAYAASTTGDTFQLVSNITENFNFNFSGTKVYTITSAPGFTYTWDGLNNATPTLQFQNGNGSTLTISNVIMDHSSASGGYVIYYNNSNVNIYLNKVTLRRTSASATNASIIRLENADNRVLNIRQSTLIGDGSEKGIDLGSGNTDSIYLENNLLYGFTGAGNAAVYLNRNNSWGGATVVNNTFFNNTTGYYDAYAGANPGSTTFVRNNLFLNNTTDYRLPTGLSGGTFTAMKLSITWNGFSVQIPDATYGAGNRYALVPATEVINPTLVGTPDLHLKWGGQSIDHATSTGAPAIDKDDVSRPQGVAVDIGAYEYVISATSCGAPLVEYVRLQQSNPLNFSSYYYDLSPVAGGATTDYTPGVSGTTGVNMAAIGFVLTTLDALFKPNQFYVAASTPPSSVPQGFGWVMSGPLSQDIAAGTWTFGSRYTNNIGAVVGGLAVNAEYSVYSYDIGTGIRTQLFVGIGNQLPMVSAWTPAAVVSSFSQPAFPGTAGKYIIVEQYVHIVGYNANPGMYWLDYNTSSDYVSIPMGSCITPSPTSSSTVTPSATSSPTFTSTASNTPSQTPSFTSTVTATPTFTATNTPSQTSTVTATQTSTSTITPSSTQTVTSTMSQTPSFTSTLTATPTFTSSNTPSLTSTVTSSQTSTSTITPSSTQTVTSTTSQTPSFSATSTATSSSTSSNTPSLTSTVTSSQTSTSTITPSSTQTVTSTTSQTPSFSATSTATSSSTSSSTPSLTSTVTSSQTSTSTVTPSATQTATSTTSQTPTSTWTLTATPTSTSSSTPSLTSTVTSTQTSTVTVTPSSTQTQTSTTSQTPTFSATSTSSSSMTPTFTNTITTIFTSTFTATPSSTSTETPTATASSTQTQTSTSTQTPTASATQTSTSTSTSSSTPSATSSPTPTQTATNSQTPSFSATDTPTLGDSPTSTHTASSTATPTQTSTVTLSSTPSMTATSSSTLSATSSPSATSTQTSTMTSTATITESSTETVTSTVSVTPTHTQTVSPTHSSTSTATQGPSFTATVTPTDTATVTESSTATASSTPSATSSATPTETATSTPSATSSVSATQTETSTETQTSTESVTSSPSTTSSSTATVTETSTETVTSTPSASSSNTGTHTVTSSPSTTSTASPTQTPTSSTTPSSSSTPSRTASPSATASATGTVSSTASRTATGTPTVTQPNSPTSSSTATPSATVTVTPTQSSTSTASPSGTETFTASLTATPTGTITPTSTQTQTFTYTVTPIPQPNHIKLKIYNSAGELVRELYEGDTQYLPSGVSMSASVLAAGQGGTLSFIFSGAMSGIGYGPTSAIVWDGTNDNGQLVAGGQYYAQIEAKDGFGNVVTLVDSVVVIRAVLSQSLSVFNSAGELVALVSLTSTTRTTRFDVPEPSKALELDPSTGLPSNGFPILLIDGSGTQIWTQWNGLNSQGVPVSPGLYTLELNTELPGAAPQRLSKQIQVLTAPSTITLGAPFAAPQPYKQGPLWVFFKALPGNETVRARLYNGAGELVLSGWARGSSGRLALDQGEKLASGIYVLELAWMRGNGVVERKLAKLAVAR